MSAHTACGYERPLHIPEQRAKIIGLLLRVLRKRKDEFDGFIVSGYSMTILGSILADKLKKHIAVMRKPSEKRNSWLNTEGPHSRRWVFVDDLICTGDTLDRIKLQVKGIDGTVVGSMFWHSERFSKKESEKRDVPCWFCRHLVSEYKWQ